MTTQEMLFGTRLCPVRTGELASMLGVTQPTIYRWKKNPGSIPWGKMKMLIKIRGLSPDDVMKMAKER